jgi:hypothetical protein
LTLVIVLRRSDELELTKVCEAGKIVLLTNFVLFLVIMSLC